MAAITYNSDPTVNGLLQQYFAGTLPWWVANNVNAQVTSAAAPGISPVAPQNVPFAPAAAAEFQNAYGGDTGNPNAVPLTGFGDSNAPVSEATREQTAAQFNQYDPSLNALYAAYPARPSYPDSWLSAVLPFIGPLTLGAGAYLSAAAPAAEGAAEGAAAGADAGAGAAGAGAAGAAADTGAVGLGVGAPAAGGVTLEGVGPASTALSAPLTAASAAAPAAAAGASLSDFNTSTTGVADSSLGAQTGNIAPAASDAGAVSGSSVPPAGITSAAPTVQAAGVPTASVSDFADPSLLSAQTPQQLQAALQATSAPDVPLVTTSTPGLSAASNGLPVSGPPAYQPETSVLGKAENLYGDISNFTNNHKLLTTLGGLAAGQLLSPALSGLQGQTSQEKALLSAANQGASQINALTPTEINTANQLIPSETTGQLPPGAEKSIDNALADDIASIRARYAQLGMSGSSAEQQDIANANNQAASQRFSLTQQATNEGLAIASGQQGAATNSADLQSNVYKTLLSDQLSRQTALQNAFAQFASSVGFASALKAA